MDARELPVGTVTLLFTDIEGSTRLLQEMGREAYVRALTDHRRLLRQAFEGHGGVEVEMQGDSFHFAFSFARDAVVAAVEGQRALREHEWESEPIRVRIGVHTGEPMQVDGLYAGLDVHRAARIMSAAHGGQVVVSERTAELVEGECPEGLVLLDLGEHLLKDLDGPQRVLQVTDDAQELFPPLRSLSAASTNLPLPTTPLIGRRPELNELLELLEGDARLVSITGPGGTGKTRIALALAAELVPAVTDRVVWIDLAPLPSSDRVVSAVADALGLREEPVTPLDLTVISYLAPRRILLLLDNFEHVLEARLFLAKLMSTCPEVRILVTSRIVLSVAGEHVYELAPLREAEGVQLFLERAAQSGLEIERGDVVAEVCRRLDFLPLAIELVAARVRLLEPLQLIERLEHRLPLLTGGGVDLPPRHQTLAQTIAWSYDLLTDEEQELFRGLSVFASSFTVDSAEAVAGAQLDTLESLVAQSLVRRSGSGRLRLLETIREFGLQKLAQSGEQEAVEERHADYFLALSETLEPHLSVGPSRVSSVDRLASELDNVYAALSRLERSGRQEDLLRLATSMWRFWAARGYFRSGREWLEKSFASTAGEGIVRARGLEALGAIYAMAGDFELSDPITEEARDLYRRWDDSRGLAETINNLGVTALSREDYSRAAALLEEAKSVAESAANTYLVAVATQNLASVEVGLGNTHRAAQLAQQASKLYEQLHDAGQAASVAMTVGFLLVDEQRHEEAAAVFARCLAAADTLPERQQAALPLIGVAALLAESGEHEAAARLVGAADALLDSIGGNWDATSGEERGIRERVMADLRDNLGPGRFDAAYGVGLLSSFEKSALEAEAVCRRRMSSGRP